MGDHLGEAVGLNLAFFDKKCRDCAIHFNIFIDMFRLPIYDLACQVSLQPSGINQTTTVSD